MKTILLLLLLLSTSVLADPWTREDTYREASYLILDTLDWAQTREISRNPNRWEETNPILGKHPSIREVDRYFVLMALVHIGVSYSLPKDWRAGFQYISIGIEAKYVYSNLQLGINARF